MRYIYLLIILCFLSCNNERVLQLPEIENAEITEVLDVSPAYIFYDETQPDSTLLNRKNLISTTNWLVNVDKRLTLRQAIPHIKFLQDKKRNAEMHKNENAKNYFTCNDTSIGDLGFLEFTDIYYITDETPKSLYENISEVYEDKIFLSIECKGNGEVYTFNETTSLNEVNIIKHKELVEHIITIQKNNIEKFIVVCVKFKNAMTFQNYISIKSELSKIESDKIIIDTNEFIY